MIALILAVAFVQTSCFPIVIEPYQQHQINIYRLPDKPLLGATVTFAYVCDKQICKWIKR